MTRSHEINQLENVAPPVCPMSPQLRMVSDLLCCIFIKLHHL